MGRMPRSGTGDELDRLAAVLNEMLRRIRDEGSSRVVTALEVVDELTMLVNRLLPNTPHARANSSLREAILNGLDNALRHTPSGGWVRVVVQGMGKQAEVVIEDSGPGLRPDQLERVFERFYSERDGAQGSGMAFALNVMTAHGGSVQASSPAGARFVLFLPRRPEPL